MSVVIVVVIVILVFFLVIVFIVVGMVVIMVIIPIMVILTIVVVVIRINSTPKVIFTDPSTVRFASLITSAISTILTNSASSHTSKIFSTLHGLVVYDLNGCCR